MIKLFKKKIQINRKIIAKEITKLYPNYGYVCNFTREIICIISEKVDKLLIFTVKLIINR